MHVRELLLHDEQRAQHEADRLLHAVMLVDHLVGTRVRAQPLGDPSEGRIAHMIRGAPDARFERRAGKSERFSGTEDWAHVIEHR